MSEPFRKDPAGYIALQRLYLSQDGKLVAEGDARASQLLAPKGGIISDKVVKRLRLDKIALEPLEKAGDAKHGFQVEHGGFGKKTVAPEAIAERATRPEEPKRTR